MKIHGHRWPKGLASALGRLGPGRRGKGSPAAARCARGGRGLLGAVPLAPGRRPPRAHLAAHPSPRARALAHGSCVLAAEAPKGSGPAPVPPVARYFHKKGIEITYIITTKMYFRLPDVIFRLPDVIFRLPDVFIPITRCIYSDYPIYLFRLPDILYNILNM